MSSSSTDRSSINGRSPREGTYSSSLGDRSPGEGTFSSSLGMYLTLLGYSMGMSDLWRFPFLSFRNGGGAFLIPFIITLFLCGVPLYFLEFSISKFSGKGTYKVWDICPLFRGAGTAVSIAYLMFICGNTIMRCWMFDFMRYTFQDPLPWASCDNEWNSPTCRKIPIILDNTTTDSPLLGNTTYMLNQTFDNSTISSSDETPMTAAEEFWQFKILELSPDISILQPIQWRYMIALFVLRAIICMCMYRSIKWIEKVMYFTTTIPLLLIIAIFIRSLTLPGWSDGLYHFFYPHFDKLLEPRIWIEAALMAFYTLAFGWGTIVCLGSHAKFRDSPIRVAIIIPLLDGFVAMFTGMVAFAVLGNMAYTYNVPVPEILNAGMTAGIVSYVTALVSFPLPQLWSFLFFTAIIITGIDEQMIPIDMTVDTIGAMYPHLYPKYRTHVLIGISVFLFVCGLPACTGAGAYIFLWVDWYSGVWIGPCVALIELVVLAWVYGLDRFSKDLSLMSGQSLPVLMRYMLAFVTPFIVFVLFITSCVEYVPPQYGSYKYPFYARILGWISVVIVLLPLVTHAIYNICRASGSLTTRIRKQLKPKDSWGPNDDDAADEYQEKKSMFENRSTKDLLLYNLCGKHADEKTASHELKKLNPRTPYTYC